MDDEFTFYPVTHNYFLGDRRLPSVTEIISLDKESSTDYSGIPEKILKRAADIGNKTHHIIEQYNRGDIDDLASNDTPVQEYLESYKIFLDSVQLEPIQAEEKYYCECHLFAGTVDIVALVGGVPSIIDIKTTNKLNMESGELQTSAYKHLVEVNTDVDVQDRYILQLRKGRHPVFEPMENDISWVKFQVLVDKYYNE